MVNANAKTPNKRKSIMNTKDEASTPSPNKMQKGNENIKTQNVKTPGKNATPRNLNKTPKPTPGKNVAKSPKQTPNPKANKQGASPKKLKMFPGTGKPQQQKGTQKPKQNNQKADNVGKEKKKRKSLFFSLKEKIGSGDTDQVVKTIEEKMKHFENRKELSKTARRKLKVLQKMKRTALGEKAPPPTPTQKRRERKQKAAVKHEGQGKIAKPNQQKQTTIEGEEESSDYEVESEVKPGKTIKTEEGSDEESDSDEEVSGEEDSAEEEESDEEESGDEEESEEESEENAEDKNIPNVPQGGKKKGVQKKNEMKAKNLKLQAMRKQGQLAGGVKPNQKRAARRAKMNTAKASVNGS